MKVKDLKKLMCKKVKDDDFQDFFENQRQFGTFDTTNASIISTSDSSITRFTFPPGILDTLDSEVRDTRPATSNAADAKISSSFMSTEVELPKGGKAVNRKKRDKKDLVREVLSSLKNTGSAPLFIDEQSFGIIPPPRDEQSFRPTTSSSPKPEEDTTDQDIYKQFGILKDSNHQVQHGAVRKRWETLKEDQDRRTYSERYEPHQQVSRPVSASKQSSRKVHRPPALVRQRNGEDPYCGNRIDSRYPYHTGQQKPTVHHENQKEDLLLANLRRRSQLSHQSESSVGQDSATTATDSIDGPILPPSRAQHRYMTKVGPRAESSSKRDFQRTTSLNSSVSNESNDSLGSLATDSESEFLSEFGSELNRSTGDSSLDSASYAYYRSIGYDEQSVTSVEMFVDHLLCATRDQILPIDWIE